MRALDTSEKAAAIQSRVRQALGPEDRFSMAMETSELAREFAKAGLRARHPGFTEDEVARELNRRLNGGSADSE